MDKIILIVSLLATGIFPENIPPDKNEIKFPGEERILPSFTCPEKFTETELLKQIPFSANKQEERYSLNCL